MRHAPRALLAAGLGCALSFLVACGGAKGLLDSGNAGNLQSALDKAGSAVSAGDCTGAVRAVDEFSTAVSNLPATVNRTIVVSLSDSADTLRVQAARDCAKQALTTPTTSTSTTSTSTVPTTTTATQPTTSTPTNTTPATTTTPPPSTSPATSSTPSGTSSGNSGGAGVGGGGSASGGAGTSSGGASSAGGNGQ